MERKNRPEYVELINSSTSLPSNYDSLYSQYTLRIQKGYIRIRGDLLGNLHHQIEDYKNHESVCFFMKSDALRFIFLFMGLASLVTAITNSLTPEIMEYSVFSMFLESENLLIFTVGYILFHYGSIFLATYFIYLAFKE